jgi:hypothetical protein
MFSAIRLAASRAVVRLGAKPASPSVYWNATHMQMRQPTIYFVQKFSTNPPVRLENAFSECFAV